MRTVLSLLIFIICSNPSIYAQNSVAREWNEALLNAIRVDFARPTVHARNLFHTSVAMYDGWAAYDEIAQPYLLGTSKLLTDTTYAYDLRFNGITPNTTTKAAQEETISYALYRILKHRFEFSPGAEISIPAFDSLMIALGYDTTFTSTDYSDGSPAALGNYIAKGIIDFGLHDGSNEQYGYNNLYYLPANPYQSASLDPVSSGNPNIQDPNRWQPLFFGTFIDQSGNPIPTDVPEFLGAEWGQVIPFALTEDDLNIYNRDGYDYWVYHDPGPPPYLDTTATGGISEEYKWSFSLVSVWSSHLKPADTLMWDISPATLGNSYELPDSFEDHRNFYDLIEGTNPGSGHEVNPATGEPYKPQFVPRGDYTRVLAEFWADGPDSETPPGHWFTILNYVHDHPAFIRKFEGTGEIMDDLEWDVKSYFTLAGALHDAAIAAWGIKGWYDYIRPISALRYMADLGQSSDQELPSYHPGGIHLIDGYIELVTAEDSLAGDSLQHVGKIKLYSWRGHNHDYIEDPDTSTAGVGWILAEEWWPYQRPTFITPPFAGYISGHSTFSRSAAEIMTMLTGDEFFPGGMAEFEARKNEFLVFEDGPSQDVILQWATYRDASDQTSLSRIWGGIHPPADDIAGRKIGIEIGIDAFQKAKMYFDGTATSNQAEQITENPIGWKLEQNYPNPFNPTTVVTFMLVEPSKVSLKIYDLLGREVFTLVNENRSKGIYEETFDASTLASGIYIYRIEATSNTSNSYFIQTRKMTVIK